MVVAGMFFVIGVGLAGMMLLWQGKQTLAETQIVVGNLDEPADAEREAEGVAALTSVRTVLVVGNDTGEVDEEYRDVATGERAGNRTDTIMLLRIDPDAREVTGIGIPRDTYIPLCNGARDKINAAWSLGGPECLIDTIRDFSGVSIDHYVEVDFAGFIGIVETVGGVTMYLDEPMQDPKAHLDLPAGCVTLDGRSALGFVRTRSDSDFGRIARQQRFLKELADEATSLSVVANPVRLFQLVESVGTTLKMDDQLDVRTLRQFAVTLRELGSEDLTMATVPTLTDNSTGNFYEIPIQEQTVALFSAFERGELAEYLGVEPAVDESEAGQPDLPPIRVEDIPPITILNSTTIDGLAARTQEAIQALGFKVALVGDADEPALRISAIRYPSQLRAEAAFLESTAFPGAELEEQGSSELTVVLGETYDPSQIRELPASATAPPEPSAETAPPDPPEYKNAERPPGHEEC